MFTKTASIKPVVKNGHHPAFAGKERSVSSFITPVQAKLNIGKQGDTYEIEADQVADKVVNKTTQNGDSSFFSPATTIQKRDIQKQEDPEEIQEKPFAHTITPLVQLEPAEEEPVQEKTDDTIQKQEEEEDVQTKMERPSDSVATIANRIREGRDNGRSLPTPTQSMMERGFGADFSGVRVHTDSIAASMNQDLGARAFTNNNDIFFNEGQFDPQSRDGQTLLAHELTHTIQQGASTAVQEIEPSLETPLADVVTEQEIDLPSTSTTENADQNQDVLDVVESDTSVDFEEETLVEEGQENLEPSEDLAEGEAEEGAEPVEAFPMSPEEDPAFNELETRVEGVSEDQQTTNPAEQETQAAQSAAAVPLNERMGGAQANQVAVMDEQEPVEFDAEAFKAKLMERIESMQLPEDQEEATEFEDNNNIQEISNAASADASQAQETTAGPISEATAAAPNVEAVPEREVTALPEAPIGQRPSSVNANSAMPNARPESQVSQPLQENMQEVDQEMIDNEVTEEQLARSNEPEFASALDSRSEARANTEGAPVQFREGETQSLNGTQQQAENASQGTLESMHGDRSNILNEVVGQQTETGTQNTTERERISTEINGIYETAKTDVETILEDLDAKVTEKFDAAAKKAKKKFEDYVEQEMDDYKDRRYSGLRGKGRWLVDKFKGLPDEVNQFFVDGRLLYIAEMDTALTDISNYIGTRLTEAKNRIELGKQEVTDYVEELPENLQSIGEEASEEIQDKFDQLTDDVNAKQDELIDSLAQQYNESLSEVDARIEEMQAANRGLIDMALDAVKGVIETIRKLKQLISDLLSEIQSSLSIILADPITFVSNLFSGVKQGFENFKSNIETHLMAGFVQWLTGALGPIGITIPEDVFSLKGIFSLVMQVLGLTWDYMREKAVKLLGEPVVRAMEFGLEMFMIIREKGVEGIWEYIKEQFADLKETIIDSIKDLLITQVIQAGIRWLLSLLIPGAGFIKAIMAIKDFIVFFVESALMLIPALIEAIRAMASGSMTLVATAIERGLALLVPLVIKLFARIIGLGGLVKKVQKIIKRIRKRIDRAINKLILKAKKAARKLLRRLGIGRSSEDENIHPGEEGDGEIGKEVTFNDGEEGHKLWVVDQGDAELMIASANPMQVKDKLVEWKGKVGSKEEWSNTKKGEINAQITDAETITTRIDQQIDVYENSENSSSGSDTTTTTDETLNRADDNIESDQDRLKTILKVLFSEFKEQNNLTVEVAVNDKIRSKYKSDSKFHAVVKNVKDDTDSSDENKVEHLFNWEKLKERDQEHNFTNFNTKWESGDIDFVPSGSVHSDYKPQIESTSIEGDYFVLNYNYGPEGLGKDELEQIEVKMKVDSVSERKINHQVTGSNMGMKASGSRGKTDSSGRLIREGVDTTNSPQMNAAHLMADWFQGSGYRQGLNLILTSDTYNQSTMAGAEANLADQIRDIQEDENPLLVTFDLQVVAVYEATKDDKIVETLEGIKPNMDAKALADMHTALAGDQDPRRCESVTYNVLSVKAGGVDIPFNIIIPPIGADIYL